MVRKCGTRAVQLATPEKHKSFIQTVLEVCLSLSRHLFVTLLKDLELKDNGCIILELSSYFAEPFGEIKRQRRDQ